MSYFDEYDNARKKIPYDDIPISRNERIYGNRNSRGGEFRVNKLSTIVLSFMIVLNLILSIVCVFYIKNTKVRTINQYTIEVGSNSEVSAAVKTSAFLSSVCVASGGSCSNDTNFYSSTLSRGSGVIYKVVGNIIYFATCYHVVSGYEDKVWVLLPTSLKPISVTVVAYSSHYDIAVLKYVSSDIENTLGGCTAIKPFDSVYVSLGERVFAIGNSLSCGLSITEGLISQVNAQIKVSSNNFLTRTLQTSAEINPGNSGGGLFNADGKFIGLVNAKRHSVTSGSETYTVVGTSYAIPSSIVCGIVNKLIQNKNKPTYVNLGVEFENDASMGKTIEYIQEDELYRQVEKYSVVVSSVSAGSISYLKLRTGYQIESIEFEMYNFFDSTNQNETITKRVEMYNKYTFDDYSFSIVEGSTIKFYVVGEENPISITATSIATVSD